MRTELLVCCLLAAPPVLAQTADSLRQLDYDHAAPLDIKGVSVEKRRGVSIHDISYASPKGGRVPAYLLVPDGKGPFAAVLWGHWYWENSEFRNRTEFLEEATALAPAGVVSLLTDGPVARPGHVQDRTPLNETQITDLIQAIGPHHDFHFPVVPVQIFALALIPSQSVCCREGVLDLQLVHRAVLARLETGERRTVSLDKKPCPAIFPPPARLRACSPVRVTAASR